MIAGLVLAAGQSRRMGTSKLVLPWKNGQTVIETTVSALRRGGIERVVVVVGSDRDRVEQALAGLGIEFVDNPDYEEGGMLSSIQAGVLAMADEVESVMLLPGDLPGVRASTVEAVRRAWEGQPDRVCAPVHGSRRGHPLAIPRSRWDELLALRRGESLRTFLHRQEDVVRVEVDDPGIHADLDTPQDYEQRTTDA